MKWPWVLGAALIAASSHAACVPSVIWSVTLHASGRLHACLDSSGTTWVIDATGAAMEIPCRLNGISTRGVVIHDSVLHLAQMVGEDIALVAAGGGRFAIALNPVWRDEGSGSRMGWSSYIVAESPDTTIPRVVVLDLAGREVWKDWLTTAEEEFGEIGAIHVAEDGSVFASGVVQVTGKKRERRWVLTRWNPAGRRLWSTVLGTAPPSEVSDDYGRVSLGAEWPANRSCRSLALIVDARHEAIAIGGRRGIQAVWLDARGVIRRRLAFLDKREKEVGFTGIRVQPASGGGFSYLARCSKPGLGEAGAMGEDDAGLYLGRVDRMGRRVSGRRVLDGRCGIGSAFTAGVGGAWYHGGRCLERNQDGGMGLVPMRLPYDMHDPEYSIIGVTPSESIQVVAQSRQGEYSSFRPRVMSWAPPRECFEAPDIRIRLEFSRSTTIEVRIENRGVVAGRIVSATVWSAGEYNAAAKRELEIASQGPDTVIGVWGDPDLGRPIVELRSPVPGIPAGLIPPGEAGVIRWLVRAAQEGDSLLAGRVTVQFENGSMKQVPFEVTCEVAAR